MRSAPLGTLIIAALLAAPASTSQCEDYFGDIEDQDGTVTTVVDPDVTEGWPFARLTFVHHSGPGSACLSPAPPKGCHRYYVATYTTSECPSTCPLITGTAANFTGKRDLDGRFDRANGILSACAECAASVSLVCWRAQAKDPQRCACPGAAPSRGGGLLLEDPAPPVHLQSFESLEDTLKDSMSALAVLAVGIAGLVVLGRFVRPGSHTAAERLLNNQF